MGSWYDPFDFSNTQGSPHESPSVEVREITCFHGCDDSVISHISSFIELCSSIGIVYEDDIMKIFVFSLKNDATRWFECLGKKRYHLL